MNPVLPNSTPPFAGIDRKHIALRDREPVTIGYVRVSPADPGQYASASATAISRYADYYGWNVTGIVFEKISGMTSWHNRPELKWLMETLKTGDRIIAEELCQIGRNFPDVAALLARFHEKGVAVCDVVNRVQIDNFISPQMMAMFYNLSAQIDRGHVAMRTKEGLAARKAKGLPIGRKKGAPAPSKLDKHKTEIISLLKSGSTKTYLMKKYNTSKTNLYHWLKKNNLEDISPEFSESQNT